jgi:hypothetical protein
MKQDRKKPTKRKKRKAKRRRIASVNYAQINYGQIGLRITKQSSYPTAQGGLVDGNGRSET